MKSCTVGSVLAPSEGRAGGPQRLAMKKTGQNLWGEQRRGLLRVPQLLALGQLLRAGIVAEVRVHYILPLWSSILLFAGERPRMPVQRI